MKRRMAVGSTLLLCLVVILLWRAHATSRESVKDEKATVSENVAAVSVKPAPPARAVPPAVSPSDAAASPVLPTPVAHRKAALPPSQLSEVSLMARLREVKATNPPLAIELARDGNRRFPDSADAPERHAILIHVLADTERRMEVRGEAEFMVNHYPDSVWVRDIEAFTGAHRHRNLRLTDAGTVKSYDPK